MKVAWLSNAPWSKSGYGEQTRIFTPRLRDAGYDIAILASYGLEADTSTWEGIPVYPRGFDAYYNDVVFDNTVDFLAGNLDAGWLFILYDAWVYHDERINKLHNAVWVPVDHDPVPHGVLSYFHRHNGVPVAMSKFGVEKFAQVDIEALYLPHGYDPVFEPKPQPEGREALGLPEDAFVVGMNAANKGQGFHRKGFSQAFEGFTRFAQKHDDVLLYVHAEATGIDGQVGWNLERMAAVFGIEDKVRFTGRNEYRKGVPFQAMPWLYSSFDVFLNPSYGEGFGIPIVEAQACGVPVVVTKHTAMKELCGDGWAVTGINMYQDRMGAFWKIPDPVQIADALGEAYDRPRGPSEKAVGFAASYHADRVFTEHMLPVFENLAERIDPAAAA